MYQDDQGRFVDDIDHTPYEIYERTTESLRISDKLTRRYRRIRAFKKYSVIFIIGFSLGCILHIAGDRIGELSKDQAPAATEVTGTYTQSGETDDAGAGAVLPDKPVQEEAPAPDAPAEASVQAASGWRVSSKEHTITTDTLIRYDDTRVITNFYGCAATGYGMSSGITVGAEADFGFELRVTDEDSVTVRTYNNTGEHIVPVSVTAGLSTGDQKMDASGDQTQYTVSGYGACPDGLGEVSVTFSDGNTLSMGVFKEHGTLYAVNIMDADDAVALVGVRENIQSLLDKAGVTEKDALYTDPVYYPIVPADQTERTDTDYWVAKSAELVEKDWSGARKAMAFYNYIAGNMAYDYYVLSQNDKGRCFLYNDYTGTWYISNTRTGICQDFADVMSIMCRAQGIPALTMSNGSHAVTVLYLEDYGRWVPVDCTADVEYGVYGEDVTDWVKDDRMRYSHFDRLNPAVFDCISIGNYPDMQYYGIPDIYNK